MKETGIIMSGNHPRLVVDGLKTMTRRTYGLKRINQNPDAWVSLGRFVDGYGDKWRFRRHGIDEEVIIKCPYGGIDDRLWIRETFSKRTDGVDQILYKADYLEIVKMLELPKFDIAWKPSIHMFRKDSRADLVIAGLRAERLQEISEEDIKKEGITGWVLAPGEPILSGNRAHFIDLWDSLNAKRGYGWDINPWVFVISFKLLETGA